MAGSSGSSAVSLYTLSEGGKAALTRWKAQLSPSMVEATPESPALLGES